MSSPVEITNPSPRTIESVASVAIRGLMRAYETIAPLTQPISTPSRIATPHASRAVWPWLTR